MPISDAHIHFFSHQFFSLLAGNPEETCQKLNWITPPQEPEELAQQWVVELNRVGVSRAALIASIPGDELSVIRAKQAFPERFVSYAMVNPFSGGMPHADLDVICLFPAMQGFSVQSSEVERVIENSSTVFVHCGVLSVGIRKKLGLPSRFDLRYSNPLDLHAVALKHPQKRFIIPHFGAGMFREALMVADLCPNILFDTSSSNSWMKYEGLNLETVFRRSLDILGADRLIFGTDSSFFPRGWNRSVFDQQKIALQALGVSEADQQKIFHENFERLFPIRIS